MKAQGTTSPHARSKGAPARFLTVRARRQPWTLVLATALASAIWLFSIPPSSFADAPPTIVDEWTAVKPPPPPVLKPVTVDPTTTAFLILDILKQTCNPERRPRCVASVPKLVALLARAMDKGIFIVYSLVPGAQVDDVLLPVRPFPGQPVVTSGIDKFLGTDLEAMLKGHNIKTVIISGTAAHGAVLHTSSEAAVRGFQVLVPVDLMSAELLYAEQYTAWHLVNAPVISAQITLTRSDLIRF